MEVQAIRQQRHPHQNQEAQRQHLYRHIFMDETAEWLGGEQHDADRNDDRRRHHRQMLGHAHCGNHAVQREHNVQNHDLDDD